MARRQRRKYTPEQRADAVRLVRKVGNLAKVARELDLTPSALRSWIQQADIDEGQGGDGAHHHALGRVSRRAAAV